MAEQDSPSKAPTEGVPEAPGPVAERSLDLPEGATEPLVLETVPGIGRATLRPFASIRVTIDTGRAISGRDDPAHDYGPELLSRLLIEPTLSAEQLTILPSEAWAQLAPVAAQLIGAEEHYAALSVESDPRVRLYEANSVRWEALTRDLNIQIGPMLEGIRESWASIGPTVAAAMKNASIAMAVIQPALGYVTSVGLSVAALQKSGSLGTMMRLSESIASIQGPAVDIALRRSRINSSLIHTPTFVPQLWIPRAGSAAPAIQPQDPARARMLDAYDVLVELEQSLRRLIRDLLEAHAGPKWWRQRVPPAINASCQLNRAKAGGDNPTGDLIDYAYIDDYRAIIMRKDNWEQVFQAVFDNKLQAEACFQWCATARPDIGHSRPLSDRMYTDFVFGARRLIAAIRGNYSRS